VAAKSLGRLVNIQQFHHPSGAEIDVVLERLEDLHLVGRRHEQEASQCRGRHCTTRIRAVGGCGAEYALSSVGDERQAALLDAIAYPVLDRLAAAAASDGVAFLAV
jgi:hypothetical protein